MFSTYETLIIISFQNLSERVVYIIIFINKIYFNFKKKMFIKLIKIVFVLKKSL